METQGQCLFCAIVSGQIQSYKVYEDDNVIAALDINPASEGHIIIFPRKHYSFIYEMPVQEMGHLMNVSRTLIPVVLQATGAQGVNLLYSAGPAAGQRTPHLFINLIPRKEGDEINLLWNPKKLSEDEFKKMQDKFISTISSFGTSPQTSSPQPKTTLPGAHPVEATSSEPPKTDEKKKSKKDEEKEPYVNISDKPAGYW